jgi:hypothetical protein
MSDDALPIWTVYDHPRDFPHCYVARKFLIGEESGAALILDWPTDEVITADTLDEIRELLERRGLTCFQRAPEDDPVIVETWI